MGQTLTHGVYLPDEGERNCYSGLAANWQILDTSVGTVAAHTAALAGKAPLVHTHTKSDITDFPAYGTTAGTICEGNDSRLSDARTPVAHTHTKSDVTDLLNSNFIPSANNSYDLGSSSYKWNNLYAKKVNTQSVNSINPGALSLPDIANYIDLTSNIPSASLDGTTNIDLSSYITSNGWLAITVPDTNTDDFVFVQVIGTLANRYFASGARGLNFISLMMPINREGNVLAKIKASSVAFCRFYHCLGHVA